jgi:hypothetical protein
MNDFLASPFGKGGITGPAILYSLVASIGSMNLPAEDLQNELRVGLLVWVAWAVIFFICVWRRDKYLIEQHQSRIWAERENKQRTE